MSENRTLTWVATGVAAAAVLLTAACGGKEVTFTPAADTGLIQPADGRAPSSNGAAPSTPAASSAVATPSNLDITRQGSTICVRNKDTGSQACVSDHGTAVVNGVVIVDGKVVSTSGSGNGSVVVNGGSVVAGAGTTPVPTSGHVTLGGAVQWSGSASGTCQRTGEVRHALVTLGNGGRLQADVVGTGVVRIALASGGDTYSADWVGDTGVVTLADKSLKINNAPVGRGSRTVRVTASLDC